MNSLAVGNKKKRHERIPKKKKKQKTKQKAKLTTDYKKTEQEVQIMLELMERKLNLNLGTEDIESDTQSTQFFCSTKGISIVSPTESIESLEEEEEEEEKDENDDDDDESQQEKQDIEDNYEDKRAYKAFTTIKTTSEEGSFQSEKATVASTYIQIDDLDTPLTQRIIKQRHITDASSLLYKPTVELHTRIVLPAEVGVLGSSMLRMLNRYYEENHKLPVEFVKALANKPLFLKDNYLYRTLCAKQFRPIFCNTGAELVQLPMRHILKLQVKKLCFTEHPELLQEHRLANGLEEIYEEYVRHVQENKIKNIFAKLSAERAAMQEMMQQALEEPEEEPEMEQQVARQMIFVQELRKQLYAEAQTRKQLLQQILDRWLMLKKLRKSQSQQHTRINLRFNVAPMESFNWKQRYENDLQEIYGEHLELYYRQQRLWKSSKKLRKKLVAEKPTKPQLKQIAKELRANYKYLFGGPNIQIKRCDLNEMELTASNSKTHSFFMRIFLDGQFVGTTRNYRLEPDFTLHINETFGIVLERRLPKEIYITLHEKSKLPKKTKLAKICISLSAAEQNNAHSQYKFSAKHEPIAGYVSVGLLYEPQNNALSNMNLMPLENVKQTAATTNVADLSEDEVEEEDKAVVNLNTCSFEEERLMFCSMEELMENKRFQLLRSRQMQNDVRTKDLRFIPALEREVIFDWFSSTGTEQDNVIDMGDWMEPIDLQRHQGKKYLKCLYDAIKDQCARLSKVMEHGENLLIGDEPGNWMALYNAIMNIFRPSRPLADNFKDRKNSSQFISLESNQTFKLIFTVVRATGIPVRDSELLSNNDQQMRESRHSDNDKYCSAQNFKYANVSPFVALIFKDKMCRTLASEGSSPTWNEQLVLQLSVNSDDLREDIKIALFDELIESQITDDANIRNVDVYQRIQTNWLGEYRLPISTLFQPQHFEGVLEFKTPQVLIGYKRASFSTDIEDNVLNDTEYPIYKEAVYLWYYISVEPIAQIPTVNTSCLECTELHEVRQQLAAWTLQVRQMQPQRYINPLICTADGKRVCLTRLLEAVPLPFDANDGNTLERLCRIVANLNVFQRYDDCMRFHGLWLNNKIVLDTTWGSAKDLGVLLCNLLLAVGKKVWLVLGLAIPHGDTAFVLFMGTGGLELCDPCSGKRYNINDVFCPLMKIYCVVSQNNIYCNIQSEMRVFMTNFNFNDISCWLPAFSKNSPAPLGGEQSLNYLYRSTLDTSEIRLNIERKIIKKISSWRTMRKTLWNRGFQSRLYNILQQLELEATNESKMREDYNYTQQLAAEFPGYKFYGFTLNFPYTNLKSISDHIKATAIHLNSDKNVEFSVAVHLEVFPNNIMSVWIFLLSITSNFLSNLN